MSRSGRIIPAEEAGRRRIEAFPYFAATITPALDNHPGDDRPIGDALSTPEEDAHRLASVDQQIYEKLQNAEREAQEIARHAYEEGFSAGEREGREFGESQYRVHMQRMDAALQQVSQAATILHKATQDELLALAFAMGEYLAARQIELSHDSVKPLLDAVLAEHPFPAGGGDRSAAVATVHLHPKDLEDLGDRYVGYPGLRMLEDPELTRGSLLLEMEDGVVEATLEQRREHLMDLLRRLRESGRL